jgi:hypothetical protein
MPKREPVTTRERSMGFSDSNYCVCFLFYFEILCQPHSCKLFKEKLVVMVEWLETIRRDCGNTQKISIKIAGIRTEIITHNFRNATFGMLLCMAKIQT